ncbi:MAG: chromosomal replication initiator protein DnaA [Bacilli bacterium]|nr:chromosomal replication initiator protein DnaA [Bacilli bacterium]MDD4282381.1 chromosomal replication initiator protein DnaA [Bacilli bacterium]MDD4718244.1 chromosomal replication initiator protein DnaA [Bacilli bacterium]
MEINNIWDNFLNKVKNNLAPMLFEAWFAETKLIALNDNKATVLVPMIIHKKHLKDNYDTLIETIFNEVTGSNFIFEYFTEEEIEKIKDENNFISENKNTELFKSNLNKNYLFENFVVGDSNKFAKTTAIAVAEKPGITYNPLFIYSNSGLGKTHLMHAIGNYIVQNSNKKVLYVTSEQFVNDFIELYRKNKNENNFNEVEKFKRKYRDIDVLMIDDIQYLEIANKTQQEFFNTFNELHTNNKQIIISSDRSPDDLKQLEDRLRTRFTWGLMVDIMPPDFELRLSIISKKIEGHGLNNTFPQEVKEYIASNCIGDIRKLEGAITRVVAYATMMSGSDITLNLAIEALKDYFGNCFNTKNNIEQVQHLVANSYNITIDDLKGKRRIISVAVPRQIAMYISRTVYNEPLAKIGLLFGGRDHTTVIHSVEKIKKELINNINLEKEINKIINNLK